MTEEVTLAPCPFCGGNATLVQDLHYGTIDPMPEGWYVQCGPCDIVPDSAWHRPKAEAIAAWNARANQPPAQDKPQFHDAFSKWKNLNHAERREVHGTLTGDGRNGPLTFRLFPAAPDEAATAISKLLKS